MLGAGFIKFKNFSEVIGNGRGGGGEEHSNSTFYSVTLCVMINFGLHHNVLCLIVLYSIDGLYAVITTNFFDTCTPIKYTKYTT